jgi:DDE superfamily endonuclease/Transposase
MPATEHNEAIKNQLIGAILGGKTIAAFAELVNIPPSTAKKIWTKYWKTGSTKNHPHSGCPLKVDERAQQTLVCNAKKNWRAGFVELGNMMNPHISATTVQEHLDEANLHQRVAHKVPYLTELQKRKRKVWADERKGYDWSKVIWSDECYVYLGDRNGRVYVTCGPDEEYDECLVPTFKQSTVQVMVWGCIMKGKRGPLVVLEYPGGKGGGLNATRYQEQVLQGKLQAFWAKMRVERGDITFQQDGAPAHAAKSTKKWLSDHSISIFPHPPSSPDLNPIEPLWHKLKRHVRARPHPPTSVQELITAVHEAWGKIEAKDVDKYVGHMDNIVDAVLTANGGHTKF